MEKVLTKEELFDKLLDEAMLTVYGWSENSRADFIRYTTCYINDWYASEYDLTSEDIEKLAQMCIDYMN